MLVALNQVIEHRPIGIPYRNDLNKKGTRSIKRQITDHDSNSESSLQSHPPRSTKQRNEDQCRQNTRTSFITSCDGVH
jgi:hypothetical protein